MTWSNNGKRLKGKSLKRKQWDRGEEIRRVLWKDTARVSAAPSENPSVDCIPAGFTRHKSRLCDTGIYFTGFIKRRLTAMVEIATDFPSKNFVSGSRTRCRFIRLLNVIGNITLSIALRKLSRGVHYTCIILNTPCILRSAKYLELTVYYTTDNVNIKRINNRIKGKSNVFALFAKFKRIIFMKLKLNRIICLSFYAWYHQIVQQRATVIMIIFKTHSLV